MTTEVKLLIDYTASLSTKVSMKIKYLEHSFYVTATVNLILPILDFFCLLIICTSIYIKFITPRIRVMCYLTHKIEAIKCVLVICISKCYKQHCNYTILK